MDTNLQNLSDRVRELESTIEKLKKQQITYPLDVESIRALQNYFMRIEEVSTLFYGGASGRGYTEYVGKQGDFKFTVPNYERYEYSVNTTTNVLNTPALRLQDGTEVVMYTSDTPPAPLTVGIGYYVVNSTEGGNFQIEATLGGGAIDITDKGLGNQYLIYI